MPKPSFPTQPTYQTTTSKSLSFTFLPLWIKKIHLMPAHINPAQLFSVLFCTLAFCRGELFVSPTVAASEWLHTWRQWQKSEQNTAFRSQNQPQYMENRKGSCCRHEVSSSCEAALPSWLDFHRSALGRKKIPHLLSSISFNFDRLTSLVLNQSPVFPNFRL